MGAPGEQSGSDVLGAVYAFDRTGTIWSEQGTLGNPEPEHLSGLGDACDPDRDGDGVSDNADSCPTVENSGQVDDGLGDACDADIDGDGVPNISDAFPTDPSESVDTDSDGIGNNADPDDDGDDIPDASDGYPLEKDGALSGGLSQIAADAPALRPLLTPLRGVLLGFGL